MYKELRAAILITILFTVGTGIVYPLAVTGVAQTIFGKQDATTSLLENAHSERVNAPFFRTKGDKQTGTQRSLTIQN